MHPLSLPSKSYFAGQFNNFRFSLRNKCALVKARCYDRILGIETAGYYNSVGEDISSNRDMVSYQPAPYGRLEKMIVYLKLTPDDIFVDLGCGKGRAVFFVALRRLKKVIGVELDQSLIDIAKKNLNNLKIKRTPIELIRADAVNFDIKEESIFFMFNPFGQLTVEKVLNNIKESLIVNPRRVRIVYYAPAHRHLLDSRDWLVPEGRIENDNCLVWRNKLYQ